MNFLDLAHKRFSVLAYEQRPVEDDVIDRILEAGLAAPTACNNQPQRIKIIKTEEDRRKLNTVVLSKYPVPVAFLVCYDRAESWTRPMDGKSSGDIDASIVATHMILEATDLGLGSIWVMYWDPEKMKSAFELDSDIEPVALIIAGYMAEDACPRKGHLETKAIAEILI